jgi:hypothetical protein
MAFIPMYCDECLRSELIDASALIDASVNCSSCDRSARIIPGSSCGAADVVLYQELADALHDAAVTPLNAAQLADQIGDVHGRAPGSALRYLAKAVPSLAFLEIMAEGAAAQSVRKAEGMLQTLLNGIASGRSQSSSMIPASGVHAGIGTCGE